MRPAAIAATIVCVTACAGTNGAPEQPDAGRPASSVTIAISSSAATVPAGGQVQMTSTVTGSSDSSVTWFTSAGAIDQTGLLTAPATLGQVQLLATSNADPTKFATAQVTVIEAVERDISTMYADKFDVIVDPYAINPLAAVVNVRGLTPADVKSMEVTVKDDSAAAHHFLSPYSPQSQSYATNWDSSDVLFAQDGLHVPVIGLFADKENQVDIVVHTQGAERIAKTLKITTRLTTDPGDSCRDCYPTIEVTLADAPRMEPGWNLVEFSIGDAGTFRTRPL